MAVEIVDVNTLFGAYPSQHADSTAESLVNGLEMHGVHWCLTLSTWGIFHNDSAGNAETMRACRQHSRLIPVATVNPLNYWGQDDTLSEIAQGHYEMFRFFPRIQGWPIRFKPFQEILGTLATSGRSPIMISVESPGDITGVSESIGAYPHPVILEGVAGQTLAEAISVLRERPSFHLEIHAIQMPDALPLLRDTVGIERILFGSDAPGMSQAAVLRYVRRSALSPEDQDAVLGGNAQRIWQAGGNA